MSMFRSVIVISIRALDTANPGARSTNKQGGKQTVHAYKKKLKITLHYRAMDEVTQGCSDYSLQTDRVLYEL